MTEAKELDPAALEAAKEALGAPDVRVPMVIYGATVDRVAEAMEEYHEALSTAPVALEVSVQPMTLSDGRADYFVAFKCGDRQVTPHVFRERFKAEYHVALYRWLLNGGEEPDPVAFDADDWPAAIHPAPSREAVIEVDKLAQEIRRVDGDNTMGAGALAEAICSFIAAQTPIEPDIAAIVNKDRKSLYMTGEPVAAPSLGEARLAEGEAVAWQWSDFSGKWYTVDTARSSVAEQEELARLVAAKYEGRVRPLYAHPSHVQAEAGEAVAPTTPKISELANDLWEALFGIMRGAVPDDLTNEVLIQLATRMAEAYSISERAAP